MNLYNNEEENKNGIPALGKGGAPFKKNFHLRQNADVLTRRRRDNGQA